jgi:hypothetical protein
MVYSIITQNLPKKSTFFEHLIHFGLLYDAVSLSQDAYDVELCSVIKPCHC